MSFLFWSETGQEWPSTTQMKKLYHTCWFWARHLSGTAFIQDSHVQQPICPSQLLLSLFSRSHWQFIGWFSPSCLPLVYHHDQSILVRSGLCLGRQNSRCHICSFLRFCCRFHFQITDDPLRPMIWDHSTGICHLQYGRVFNRVASDLLQVITPSHLEPPGSPFHRFL